MEPAPTRRGLLPARVTWDIPETASTAPMWMNALNRQTTVRFTRDAVMYQDPSCVLATWGIPGMGWTVRKSTSACHSFMIAAAMPRARMKPAPSPALAN
jgi:hypothetical protein